MDLFHQRFEWSYQLYQQLSKVVSILIYFFNKGWFVFMHFFIILKLKLSSNLNRLMHLFFKVIALLNFSNLVFEVIAAFVIIFDPLIIKRENVSFFQLLLFSYFSFLLWLTWILYLYLHESLAHLAKLFEGNLIKNFEWQLILIWLS